MQAPGQGTQGATVRASWPDPWARPPIWEPSDKSWREAFTHGDFHENWWLPREGPGTTVLESPVKYGETIWETVRQKISGLHSRKVPCPIMGLWADSDNSRVVTPPEGNPSVTRQDGPEKEIFRGHAGGSLLFPP